MTERRDPIPFSGLPATPADGPRRPLPFVRMAGPPLSRRKLSAAAVAGVALILVCWAALKLVQGARTWLHERPEYVVSFDRIVLDPPPPDVMRSGRETILRRVREKAKLGESIRLLDQDLEELGLAFAKYSPWVAKVEKVERSFPDRIALHLVYRKPVARVGQAPGTSIVIAGDGVVLPEEDLWPEEAAKLVRIDGFKALLEARPGLFFGSDEGGKVPGEVAAAIRLARFLQETRARSEPRIVTINLSNGPGKIMLKTRRNLWVYWGNGPGDEGDREATAREKLDLLSRWEDARPDRPAPVKDYLEYTRDGARLHSAGP